MIGIDAIDFATSRYFLDMKNLAEARNVDANKYYVGIHQEQMSIAPPNEDIITLGYAAASQLVRQYDSGKIGMFLFATETAVDNSKSAGSYLHDILNLSDKCVTFEIKQACYAGTAALFTAYDYVSTHKDKIALVIASDIARYGLHVPGEATQGCGAVAMVISHNPRIVSIRKETGTHSANIHDFWRPTARSEAIVDGALSAKSYITSMKNCFKDLQNQTGITVKDIDYFCYHTPFGKMAIKGHQHLTGRSESDILESLTYNNLIGNSYTASLYIALISLLENTHKDMTDAVIGMYSYGSGSVAQYFLCDVIKGYEEHIDEEGHKKMLSTRKRVSVQEYEKMFTATPGAANYETSGKLVYTGVDDKLRRQYVLR